MKSEFKLTKLFNLLALAGAVAALGACGGSGGGGGDSSSAITLAGTAASGKAFDGATISITCKTGTGSATSAADGTYTSTIVNGVAPCLLTATKGAVVLRSVAQAAGTVNVTPLTDMLVAYLATRAGTTPDLMATSVNGKAIMADTASMTTAKAAVQTLLKTTYNIDVGTDFATAPIVTTAGSQTASDKLLDSLKTAGAITTTGAPAAAATSAVTTSAQTAPKFVAPTGAV